MHLQLNSNDDHMILGQDSTLVFQQLENTPTYKNEIQNSIDNSQANSQNENQIITIDLDLQNETINDDSNDDDENSLPEIFLKRIHTYKSQHYLLPYDNSMMTKS